MDQLSQNICNISIHAPARGATKRILLFDHIRCYFNPRSREGSDKHLFVFIHVAQHFNPRSREGSDTSHKTQFGKLLNFNPRSREGSDWFPIIWERGLTKFQSTLPRGERLQKIMPLP